VSDHANFWTAVGSKLLALCYQILTKLIQMGSHPTISVASRPLDILHMGLLGIGNVAVWFRLLVPHWCHAVPIFGLLLAQSYIGILQGNLNQN
jgi:hypothetical protein